MSQSIGFSIYLLIVLSGIFDAKKSIIKAIGLMVIFILGGWLGTFSGYFILYFVGIFQFGLDTLKAFLLDTTLLAIIFGALVTGYFAMRDQIETMAARLAEKEINEQRLMRLKTRAELEALRAKVNPHFLFNTLNSIASLIAINPAKAEEMVQRLANLFRRTLDASSRDFVKLADELTLVREYLEIERVRLGSRLQFQINCDEQLAETLVPGLLLQPLVENSVKHGIAPLQKGGEVRINCWQEQDLCCIRIQDTGKGLAGSEMSNGFGLQAVQERLELLYGEKHTLQIFSENGTAITIRLPLNHVQTDGKTE